MGPALFTGRRNGAERDEIHASGSRRCARVCCRGGLSSDPLQKAMSGAVLPRRARGNCGARGWMPPIAEARPTFSHPVEGRPDPGDRCSAGITDRSWRPSWASMRSAGSREWEWVEAALRPPSPRLLGPHQGATAFHRPCARVLSRRKYHRCCQLIVEAASARAGDRCKPLDGFDRQLSWVLRTEATDR